MSIEKSVKSGLTLGIALSAAALCMTGSVIAAEEKSGKQMSSKQQSMQGQPTYRASQLIGKDVKNPQGKNLGEIEELVLDNYGRIQYVAVSHGGFLDIGDKLVAIPWHAFETPEGKDYLQLDVTEEQLSKAPNFDKDNWQQAADTNWIVSVTEYYMVPGQVGQQTASLMSSKRTFSSLDMDNDGNISRQEVQQLSRLSQQFDQADRNSDGEISRSEFSAFEEQHGFTPRGQTPGKQKQSPGSQSGTMQ